MNRHRQQNRVRMSSRRVLKKGGRRKRGTKKKKVKVLKRKHKLAYVADSQTHTHTEILHHKYEKKKKNQVNGYTRSE
jgi:hypothetical protein